jgi:hypothetical protein
MVEQVRLWSLLLATCAEDDLVCQVQTIAPVPNTQSHLLRIVSTLERDYMKSQPPASLLDLEQYAEGTSSQLLYLQVHPSTSRFHRGAFVTGLCSGLLHTTLTSKAYKNLLILLIRGIRSHECGLYS